MSNPELNSLDDFQHFVSSTISPWSREQRIALAAGMAERWLPVYESFCEEEEWGDPEAFQRAVHSAWNCVLGKALTSREHGRHKESVEENTPHLDDFDAEEVIATSAMIDYALNCCVSADNTDDAVMAMVSGFEGVAPGIYTDSGDVPPGVWQSPEVQDQFKQKLNQLMDDAPSIDKQEIEDLRQQLMSLPVVTDEGIGPLPPEIWESPEISEQIEKTLKLREVIGDMVPFAHEQIEAFRQEVGSTEAEESGPDLWQLPQVQDELKKQLKLLELVRDMTRIDKRGIEELRTQLISPDLVGSPAPRPEPSRGQTNEAIFEQYRRMVEADLKNKWDWENSLDDLGGNSGAIVTMYVAEWMGRYSRRKDAIEEGQMKDVQAYRALLARNVAHDAAVQGDPGWDEDSRMFIDMIYQNPYNGLEVHSVEEPHRYGPSLRRLWLELKPSAASEKDLWKSIVGWGHRRPPAWEEETQRKKNKLTYSSPELGERLTRKLSWHVTNDLDHPWATEVGAETWRVRLNDFPDDLMYTLIIDDAVIGSFHDWPESWHREN